MEKEVKRISKKKETETKRKIGKTQQSYVWFPTSSVLCWSVLQVHSAFLDKHNPHHNTTKHSLYVYEHTYMQKHPHITPCKTIYRNQKSALYVFNWSSESLEKHNASEMEGTTLKALPRERRTMSSAQLIQNILLIQRILGEYREGFLYF